MKIVNKLIMKLNMINNKHKLFNYLKTNKISLMKTMKIMKYQMIMIKTKMNN